MLVFKSVYVNNWCKRGGWGGSGVSPSLLIKGFIEGFMWWEFLAGRCGSKLTLSIVCCRWDFYKIIKSFRLKGTFQGRLIQSSPQSKASVQATQNTLWFSSNWRICSVWISPRMEILLSGQYFCLFWGLCRTLSLWDSVQNTSENLLWDQKFEVPQQFEVWVYLAEFI